LPPRHRATLRFVVMGPGSRIRLAGTTEIVDLLFKQPLRIRHCANCGRQRIPHSTPYLRDGGKLPLPLRERVGVRGSDRSIDCNPSPESHLAMRSDLSHKGRGGTSSQFKFFKSQFQIRLRIPAAPMASGFFTTTSLANRGRRECRARDAPAASRAKQKSTRDSHHRSAERSGTPCANGFNGLLRALPGDRALLSPSSARCMSIVTDLMPASRHQDHAILPSATGAFVLCATRVHRIPHPTFVTIAKRPSFRDGMEAI